MNTWIDATLHKAHRYDEADSPFAGSKLGLERADRYSLYKELSDVTEFKYPTVTKILQSLTALTHYHIHKPNF